MNFTVRFANPFIVTTYTGAALAIGWAIGVHWGHTTNASLTLIAAAILLYLHDVAIGIVLAMTIARALVFKPDLTASRRAVPKRDAGPPRAGPRDRRIT